MAIIKVANRAIDLDAAEIPNLDASKITTGNFDASRIGSGTFADARIAASNVSQHATSFDDNKIVNDISTLALRQASNENKSAYNTNSMYVDVFQDSSGITNLTNSSRDSGEFIHSQANVTNTITLNSSNYQTYMDITDNDFMSVRKYTSGATDTTSIFNTAQSNNVNFSSGSSYQANQTITNAMEPTLASYIFADNSSSTQYRIQNTDTSATYRLIYFNFEFKSGTTFKPNGAFSVRAANGLAGWNNIELEGVTDSFVATNMISIANPSGDESGTISNSTFFPRITVRSYHGVDNSGFLLDKLSIAGDMTALSTSATGSFEGVAITAPSSTNKMGAIITYQDNAGTNALNTDIVLKLSADGGSNYSTATLTAMPDFASGIKMAKVNDLSVTAGTSLKYKIEFANQASGSKEARIRGVSLQY